MSCIGRGHRRYRGTDDQGRWRWYCYDCPDQQVAAPLRGCFPDWSIVTSVVPHDGPCHTQYWSKGACVAIVAWGRTRDNSAFRSFRCGESVMVEGRPSTPAQRPIERLEQWEAEA